MADPTSDPGASGQAAAQAVDAALERWARFDLFRGMDREILRLLLFAMRPVIYPPGAALIRQGERGTDMFLLDAGRVHVVIHEEDGSTRFETDVEAPALVGEMALVTHEPRNATVTASGEVRCLRVGQRAFRALVEDNPAAAAFLTRAVGRRLMDAHGIRRVGKYEVLGRLGKGGVATVFEGVHVDLQLRVALKMLAHDLVYKPGFAEPFRREARLIARLDHPGIVRVSDTEEAYGTHFIVMERVAGRTLDELIAQPTPVDFATARQILVEVASALHYSHERGVLHRDVKPTNIMVMTDGRAKLLDFSIAISVDRARPGGQIVYGTPHYMAPEQYLQQQLDGRVDLYALGIVAYELVTGRLPFEISTFRDFQKAHIETPMPDPRSLAPDVPADLVEFIARATRKRPVDRFASCGEAVSFLQQAGELPVVDSLDLTTLAISSHPSLRRDVETAVADLRGRLGRLPGVTLAVGHQQGKRRQAPAKAR